MAVRVEVVEGMGRVAVATRSFKLGDIVMEERPLLVWPSADFEGYVRGFLKLSPDKQAKVTDMYHPSLDTKPDFAAELHFLVPRVSASTGMPEEEVKKLFSIVKANAHAFIGEQQEYFEVVGGRDGADRSALFEMASKVAHSCLPNCLYSSKSGCLRYTAARSIAEGEQITFSYLGELWSSPIERRRAKLLQTKDFVCRCVRCSAPDDCRRMACPAGCKGFVQPVHTADMSPPSWSCGACGPVKEARMKQVLKKESELQEQLAKVKLVAQSGRLDTVRPGDLDSLLKRVTDQLSPTHWLAVAVLDFTATVCASHCVQLEQLRAMMPHMRHPLGTPAQLRRHAAMAAVQSAGICECLAAGCDVGTGCKLCHEPCPEMMKEMFHAGQDLLAMEEEGCARDQAAVDLARSIAPYVKFMFMDYGDDDPDVLEVSRATERLQRQASAGGRGGPGKSSAAQKEPKPAPGGSATSCALCGASSGGVLRCARCKVVAYCSKDCQRKHWKTHKVVCAKS